MSIRRCVTWVLAGIVFAHSHPMVSFAQVQSQVEIERHLLKNKRSSFSKDADGNFVNIGIVVASDEHVEAIDFGALKKLLSLSIDGDKVTNRSLVHLRKLPPGLVLFHLIDAQIDDKELIPFLRQQQSLLLICLEGSTIGDRTMSEIGKLVDLGSLDLRGTKVTDAGLKALAEARPPLRDGEVPSLGILKLSGTAVTDAALREIRKMKVRQVRLGSTKITDVGLSELAGSMI